MKHLYRITWSGGTSDKLLTCVSPYALFQLKDEEGYYPVVIERLD